MQKQMQQSPYSGSDSSNNHHDYNNYNHNDNSHPFNVAQTPEPSPSIVSSPGGTSQLTEENVLQSFTGQMMHDTFYMHVNLPAEHPRNDPTSFVYLPSELEYCDTAAFSPSSGSTNSSEIDSMSPKPY
jgi:hypothetical protein